MNGRGLLGIFGTPHGHWCISWFQHATDTWRDHVAASLKEKSIVLKQNNAKYERCSK